MRLLYLTHTAGFRHDVLPLSHQVVRDLGKSSGAFDVTVTEDCGAISAAGLRDYDAVFFYTVRAPRPRTRDSRPDHRP